jgi:hypothetical protein
MVSAAVFAVPIARAADVFKNLRTSTKLYLLCGAFVGSIVLATFGLIQEKQIAIEFVRKELMGARYLETVRGVYAAMLAADDGAPKKQSVDAALNALAAAEADTGGALHTALLRQRCTRCRPRRRTMTRMH